MTALDYTLSMTPGSVEADALFSRMTVQPDQDRRAAIMTLIATLKAAGIWARFDGFYVMAAHTSQAARLNWVADRYNLTAVAGPIFTPNRGYQGDGAAAYLDTGLSLTTPGLNYQRSSAHMGIWSLTHLDGTMIDMGVRQAGNVNSSFVTARYAGSVAITAINAGSGFSAGNPTNVGHFVGVRSAETTLAAYKDSALLGTSAQSSAGVSVQSPTVPIAAGKTGGLVSSYSARQYAAAHIGGALTAVEISRLHAALQTYLAIVGAAA